MGTATLISLDEFERLDGPEEIELLKGELIRVPPPQIDHMKSAEALFRRLYADVERLRQTNLDLPLGKVHMEMGYLMFGEPRSWLRPDVSVTHANQAGAKYYEGAPLMVFEIVSEYDTARQLESKVAVYLANGAAEVWVIYPEARHAWVYSGPIMGTTGTARGSQARSEAKSIRSDLLPGVEIDFVDFL
jgi:Uma2 family endonuclease